MIATDKKTKNVVNMVLLCMLAIALIAYLYIESIKNYEIKELEKRCDFLCNKDSMLSYGITPTNECVCGSAFYPKRFVRAIE